MLGFDIIIIIILVIVSFKEVGTVPVGSHLRSYCQICLNIRHITAYIVELLFGLVGQNCDNDLVPAQMY